MKCSVTISSHTNKQVMHNFTNIYVHLYGVETRALRNEELIIIRNEIMMMIEIRTYNTESGKIRQKQLSSVKGVDE